MAVATDVDRLKQTRAEIRPRAVILLVPDRGHVHWRTILEALRGVRTLVFGDPRDEDFRDLLAVDGVEFIPTKAGAAGVIRSIGGPRA